MSSRSTPRGGNLSSSCNSLASLDCFTSITVDIPLVQSTSISSATETASTLLSSSSNSTVPMTRVYVLAPQTTTLTGDHLSNSSTSISLTTSNHVLETITATTSPLTPLSEIVFLTTSTSTSPSSTPAASPSGLDNLNFTMPSTSLSTAVATTFTSYATVLETFSSPQVWSSTARQPLTSSTPIFSDLQQSVTSSTSTISDLQQSLTSSTLISSELQQSFTSLLTSTLFEVQPPFTSILPTSASSEVLQPPSTTLLTSIIPTTAPLPNATLPSNYTSIRKGPSANQVTAMVIGGLFAVALLLFILSLCLERDRQRKHQRRQAEEERRAPREMRDITGRNSTWVSQHDDHNNESGTTAHSDHGDIIATIYPPLDLGPSALPHHIYARPTPAALEIQAAAPPPTARFTKPVPFTSSPTLPTATKASTTANYLAVPPRLLSHGTRPNSPATTSTDSWYSGRPRSNPSDLGEICDEVLASEGG